MTRSTAFWRKVAYLAAVAVLFVPISRLSAPATTENEGGVLSQMRTEMDLSPAQLGKIDPASASMSLATLGMRGVAANLLWSRANHYKKTENFDSLMATLGQIAKLQPNFVSVWQHQAWNISYNASVEFDDYHHRYEWVKKGLDYLIEGTTYNRKEPLLLWDAGWFFGHKIGKSDEYLQFRRLFRVDEDFHAQLPIDLEKVRGPGPDFLPDNWKVAHQWFRDAARVVDDGASITRLAMHYMMSDRKVVDKRQTAIRGKNPLVFFSDPPKALINYADAIEKDGYLDEVSLIAWRIAARAWEAYGQRPILSSYGFHLRLAEMEARQQRAEDLERQLRALVPGLQEKLVEQRRAQLTEEELDVVDKPRHQLETDQFSLRAEAQAKLNVSLVETAQNAPKDVRAQAIALAIEAEENHRYATLIGRYREIVNFENWQLRCQMEQEPATLAARKSVYDAEKAFKNGDLVRARELFEEGWDQWSKVFQRYPMFVDDVEGEIVVESVVKYKKLLDQYNEPFPPPGFKLFALIKSHAIEYPEIATPEGMLEVSPDDESASEPQQSSSSSVSGNEQQQDLSPFMEAPQPEQSPGSQAVDDTEPINEDTSMEPDDDDAAAQDTFALRYQVETIDGESIDLQDYLGQVLLIVNVASACGLTPQYEQLQAMHKEFADDGLNVVGFPCNQFGEQEPGTETEIKEFCENEYGVTFDMFAKIDVNGDDAKPLYKQLTALELPPAGAGPIRWNFEKFLINRAGHVIARFAPATQPDDPELVAQIEKELKTDN